jgi:hypothetical protein
MKARLKQSTSGTWKVHCTCGCIMPLNKAGLPTHPDDSCRNAGKIFNLPKILILEETNANSAQVG